MQQGWLVQAYGIPEGVPVVLLHGFMQDATVWESTAEALASAHYVVAPTMAPAEEGAASLADLAEGVYGVVQQVDQAILGRGSGAQSGKAVLVGYSMGGRIALEFARRFPDALAGLVVESASLGPNSEGERAVVEKRNLVWARQFANAPSMKQVVEVWENESIFASQQSLSAGAKEAQRRIRLRRNKDHLVWLLREAGAHTMPLAAETRSMLVGLQVPVLYVAGQKDQKGMEEANRIEALNVQHMQTTRFACGHNVHLESPVAYAERLAEFVSSVV